VLTRGGRGRSALVEILGTVLAGPAGGAVAAVDVTVERAGIALAFGAIPARAVHIAHLAYVPFGVAINALIAIAAFAFVAQVLVYTLAAKLAALRVRVIDMALVRGYRARAPGPAVRALAAVIELLARAEILVGGLLVARPTVLAGRMTRVARVCLVTELSLPVARALAAVLAWGKLPRDAFGAVLARAASAHIKHIAMLPRVAVFTVALVPHFHIVLMRICFVDAVSAVLAGTRRAVRGAGATTSKVL
jgi:hypothetical protein